ncbi:MAG: PEGA domain-containing protein [Myxococcota bacterium]|nr:PEGA domain-containing protein [Myxococcota bacterium]
MLQRPHSLHGLKRATLCALWLTLQLCVSTAFAEQDDPVEEAGAKQVAGISAAKQGDYTRAYQLFQEAYALYPEAKTLYLIARLQARRGDSCEAVTNAWRRFQSECQGCTEQQKGKAALREHRRLCEGVLSLRSDPSGALVHLEGVELGRTPLQKTLNAGEYTFKFSREGYETLRKTIELDRGWARETTTVRLTPIKRPVPLNPRPEDLARQKERAAEEPLSSRHRWAIVSLSVGLGSLVTGLYLNLDATSEQSALQSDLNRTRSRQAAQMLVDERYPGIESSAQWSYITLGLGVGLVGTGLALWFLDETSAQREEVSTRASTDPVPRASQHAFAFSPYFDVGGLGFQLLSEF